MLNQCHQGHMQWKPLHKFYNVEGFIKPQRNLVSHKCDPSVKMFHNLWSVCKCALPFRERTISADILASYNYISIESTPQK